MFTEFGTDFLMWIGHIVSEDKLKELLEQHGSKQGS